MYMAFQHSGREGFNRYLGYLGAWLDRGPYSHTEILLSDGRCCTSETKLGVVIRERELPRHQWDFIYLPDSLEQRVLSWYTRYEGSDYDWRGNYRFASGFVSHDEHSWFCTESNMESLGFRESWRYGPNGAYALLSDLYYPLPKGSLPEVPAFLSLDLSLPSS